ncbi:hypothetical protein GCM10010116_37650 [Microbispora rosea subsp. aerata]|nr:hypothetical protein GCM10010116_37650 [Microbispora rosea subsp. aerata]GIH54338.1 hypothetical protein Mro02_12520 [Microbispora rosea subsp. aerata]GLJ81308.1 hypothetical protein GCM10017588_00310 [Microbispora rosea subsp. aerata]
MPPTTGACPLDHIPTFQEIPSGAHGTLECQCSKVNRDLPSEVQKGRNRRFARVPEIEWTEKGR